MKKKRTAVAMLFVAAAIILSACAGKQTETENRQTKEETKTEAAKTPETAATENQMPETAGTGNRAGEESPDGCVSFPKNAFTAYVDGRTTLNSFIEAGFTVTDGEELVPAGEDAFVYLLDPEYEDLECYVVIRNNDENTDAPAKDCRVCVLHFADELTGGKAFEDILLSGYGREVSPEDIMDSGMHKDAFKEEIGDEKVCVSFTGRGDNTRSVFSFDHGALLQYELAGK